MKKYFIKINNYVINGIIHKDQKSKSNNMKFQVYGIFIIVVKNIYFNSPFGLYGYYIDKNKSGAFRK